MQDRERRTIPIYVFGRKYEVPEGLTIQKAMEFVGYKFIRSCGCRGGICGSCLTEYRVPGSYQLKVVLACQALTEAEMELTQSPFVPMHRAQHDLGALRNVPGVLGKVYPEIYRCLQCNTCTRVCPMEIPVMDYVANAIQGDISKVAVLSFPCVMCGACASKCPAEISQPNVALLARRIYGRHLITIPQSLYQRISEIEKGRFDEVLDKLTKMDTETLMEIYDQREQEPQDNQNWVPKDPSFPEGELDEKKRLKGGQPEKEGKKQWDTR